MIAALAVLVAAAPIPPARAEILCKRDAEIVAVAPRFEDDDPCVGRVTLQGISYKCGKPSEYDARMREFLGLLQSNGAAYCREYCAKRAPGCKGRFDEPTRCGWTVPKSEVLHIGKEAPCSDACEGKAFIYCSIFHGSYLRVEESMLEKSHPNCTCSRD